MKTIRVGYQGINGSNAQAAAKKFFKKTLKDVEFIPLISSKNCVDALNKSEVDFIVCAIKNSIAGEVLETKEALKGTNIVVIKKTEISIHHCCFAKNVDISKIKYIASHIQALKQTMETRAKLMPKLKELELEDTAIGAKLLSENKLDENVMVICRENAGKAYGLKMLFKNIEDNKNNKTEFGLFTLKK